MCQSECVTSRVEKEMELHVFGVCLLSCLFYLSFISLSELHCSQQIMIKKQAYVSKVKTLGKAFIIGELFAFVGCYSLWSKMNVDQVKILKSKP